MKILVFAKQVPTAAATLKVSASGDAIIDENISYQANEPDLYAIEEGAHQIGQHGGELVVATIGPARAKDVLHLALAKGATDVLHVVDDTFGGSDPAFNLAAARTVVDSIQPDLILCGVHAEDTMRGQFGTLLAGSLSLPVISAVVSITLDPANRQATATREMGGGFREQLQVKLPGVLTIQFGIRPLRYTSIMSVVKMKRRPIKSVTLDATAANSSTAARTVSIAAPRAGQQCEFIEGSPEVAAVTLLNLLLEKGAITRAK